MRASTIPRVIRRACALVCYCGALMLLAVVESALVVSTVLLDPPALSRLSDWMRPIHQKLDARFFPPPFPR